MDEDCPNESCSYPRVLNCLACLYLQAPRQQLVVMSVQQQQAVRSQAFETPTGALYLNDSVSVYYDATEDMHGGRMRPASECHSPIAICGLVLSFVLLASSVFSFQWGCTQYYE